MAEPLITLKDLTYRPSGETGTTVLHRVNLEIRAGERVAIIGANGSGKTTLLKLISGDRLLGGHLDGEVITNETLTRRRGAIGYVRQRPVLFPWLNVRQNIGFSTSLSGAAVQDGGQLDAHLVQFGCASLARKYPAQLSGGEAQRAALAQSLFPCPTLLLLDEPFSAMDVPVKTVMMDSLRSLWQDHGFAVALVSHDFRDVLRLADRIFVLGRSERGSTITKEIRVEAEQRADPPYIKEMLWSMSEATNYQLPSA